MTRDSHTDRELWSRATQRSRESAGPSGDETADALTLSGYLEGRLSDAERDAFEARLAAEPGLLDALVSSRAALADSPAKAPQVTVTRAQAIIGRAGRVDRARGGGFLAGWLKPLGWAALCALALVVSGAGFEIGREGYDAVVEYQTLMTETVAFGFPDPASDLIL